MKTETKRNRTITGTRVDARYAELKQMLVSRQRTLLEELHGRIRNVRDEGPRQDHAAIALGDSEVDIQDDLEFVLIEMKSEMANKIEAALARLEEGSYGLCFECGEPIAQTRLRALPFAVRCQACEERREQEHGQARQLAVRRGSLSLFPDMVSS